MQYAIFQCFILFKGRTSQIFDKNVIFISLVSCVLYNFA